MNWYESAVVPPGFVWPGEVGLLGLAVVTLLACGALLILVAAASRHGARGRRAPLRIVSRRSGTVAVGR